MNQSKILDKFDFHKKIDSIFPIICFGEKKANEAMCDTRITENINFEFEERMEIVVDDESFDRH